MMKQLNILLICLLFIGYMANGQSVNLVPNPSFELKNSCPGGTSAANTIILNDPTYTQFPTVLSWIKPLYDEADYFNTCYNPSIGGTAGGLYSAGVPSNWYGTMPAHTGNAYVGCWAQEFYPRANYRSYVEAKLNQKMIAGHKYYVSFYTAPGGMTGVGWQIYHIMAVDRIGAAFSDTVVQSPSTAVWTIPNVAGVVSPKGQFFTDTTRWTKVEGIYIAKGNEQWVTLGHFPDTPISTVLVRNNISTNINSRDSMCYMYYDDVSVIDMSSSDAHVYDTSLCATSLPLTLSPADTGTKYFWSTGDSSATITVKDTGTYWRGAFGELTYYTDTYKVHVIPTPPLDLGKDSAYCPGSTVLLLANHPYVHYLWNTGDTTLFLVAKKPGQYILKVTDPCRSQVDTINITFIATAPPQVADTAFCLHTVDPRIHVVGDSIKWYTIGSEVGVPQQPVINTSVVDSTTLYITQTQRCGESPREAVHIGIVVLPSVIVNEDDTTLCNGSVFQVNAVSSNNRYQWNTGDTTCCIKINTAGAYIVAAKNECGITEDSMHLYLKNCEQCIWAPTAFTPNGDGKNDVFNIRHICQVSEFHIMIANRWGTVVFESNDIANSWDGTIKGVPAPVDTYFYQLTAISGFADLGPVTLKGDVTLIR